jgi:ELWxxDGT repeat protein
MKSFMFLRRRLQSPLIDPPITRSSVHRDLRFRLRLETLEDRVLPSLLPHLFKDVNPATPNSRSAEIEVGSVVYFGANDGVHGSELWRTDGTSAGTKGRRTLTLSPAFRSATPSRAQWSRFGVATLEIASNQGSAAPPAGP